MEPKKEKTREPQTWANRIHEVFKSHGITQVSYVPDAGHSRLIQLCRDDQDLRTVVLTTEEEGVALALFPRAPGVYCPFTVLCRPTVTHNSFYRNDPLCPRGFTARTKLGHNLEINTRLVTIFLNF